MIYIYIDGLEYKHDIFQLLNELLDYKDISFVSSKSMFKKINDYDYKFYLENRGEYVIGEMYHLDEKNILKESENLKYNQIISKKSLENNAYKRLIYKLLDEKSLISKEIEWGILTGIRPMKIIHKFIDKGLKEADIKSMLRNEYLLKNRIISEMIRISNIQRKHMDIYSDENISLYIHIPFCPSKCSYCSFSTFIVNDDYSKISEYLDVLIYEIKETAKILKNKTVNTLYIGGGTPTSIKQIDLLFIIKTIFKEFNINNEGLKEFTVEAGRPDTIDESYLKALKDIGVSRISINPQSMNDKTLKKIGRLHDKNSIISAYNLAKQIEFDIINMDVILGLPGEDLTDIENTIKNIVELSPENITIHSLAIKNGSSLKEKDYEARESICKEELIDMIDSYMSKSNMDPYYLYRQKQSFANSENIGYAKQDKESIYNILMMEERETIIGLGLGSVSKIINHKNKEIIRVPNFKGMRDYLLRVDELIINKQQVVNKSY